MKRRFVIAASLAAVIASATTVVRADTHHHSMAEYAYLVGSWHCVAKLPDGRGIAYETSFRWKYASKGVIDQYIDAKKYGQSNYMLMYVPSKDAFYGVFVTSKGDIGFWKNPGPGAGGWTEHGYSVTAPMLADTRSVFTGVTSTHYFIRNYVTKGLNDAGKFVESDDCTKTAT